MGVCLLYGLITVAEAVSIELRVRRLQEKLTADSGRGYYVDDDDRWLWGAFYYNPDDCRVIVNARTGINATFNLAKRPGQIIALFLAAMMLALPLVGVWEMRMERAPVELEVTETELVGSYFGGDNSKKEIPQMKAKYDKEPEKNQHPTPSTCRYGTYPDRAGQGLQELVQTI